MKITIVGRKFNVTEDLKAKVEKKLAKLDKFFADEASAFVTMRSERSKEILEITINHKGTMFRSEVADDAIIASLDKSIDIIERQIRKNKTRLAKRLREGAFDAGIIDTGEDFEEETEFNIRRKSFAIKPMSAEEAIMQMNLLEHEFFVFKDDKTDEICVVYKRRDGDYGLIEAQE